MLDEIEILEPYIKRAYGTKEKFAEAIGMTRQNLSHHFRQAKKNGNKFTYQFKATLWNHNIKVFAMETAKSEFHTPTNILREGETPYGNDVYALNKIIEMQDEKIRHLERELIQLREFKANHTKKAS